jgi:hypothetical protein
MNRNLFCIAILLCACGKEEASPAPPSPPASGLAHLALPADPGEALTVLAAKAAKDGDVVVEGRIGHVVKGFVSFQLVDTSLDYCGAGKDPMDDCDTPWDYCCTPQDQKNDATLLVEAHDANGRPLKADALPGLRLLDRIAVKGKLVHDSHGNATILATGWFRRDRPPLRDGLRWP